MASGSWLPIHVRPWCNEVNYCFLEHYELRVYCASTISAELYLSMLHVIFPHSFISSSIGIIESPVAFTHSLYKVPIIHVPQGILGATNTLQKPDVLTSSMLESETSNSRLLCLNCLHKSKSSMNTCHTLSNLNLCNEFQFLLHLNYPSFQLLILHMMQIKGYVKWWWKVYWMQDYDY